MVGSVDYIIVGQGFAGSCLALQLLGEGKSFIVFDEPDRNISSRVAAGMFNPVTGRKMVKTWLANELFPYLFTFYRQAERTTASDFLHEMPMYRPFVSIEEQNEWMSRGDDPEYAEIIGKIFTKSQFSEVNDPFGGLMLKNCGFVQPKKFLDAVNRVLEQKGSMSKQRFVYDLLRVEQAGVTYDDSIRSRRIIFCEGVGVSENPWFSDVPVTPLKGEVLSIKTSFGKHVILNRGVYMVPSLDEATFRVGSTYQRAPFISGNTSEGLGELSEKLQKLMTTDFSIEGQEWGIRPVTADKKPVIGVHPEFSSMYIFNGLGTKGVSLAPYFSRALVQWVEGGKEVHQAVNLSRFK